MIKKKRPLAILVSSNKTTGNGMQVEMPVAFPLAPTKANDLKNLPMTLMVTPFSEKKKQLLQLMS